MTGRTRWTAGAAAVVLGTGGGALIALVPLVASLGSFVLAQSQSTLGTGPEVWAYGAAVIAASLPGTPEPAIGMITGLLGGALITAATLALAGRRPAARRLWLPPVAAVAAGILMTLVAVTLLKDVDYLGVRPQAFWVVGATVGAFLVQFLALGIAGSDRDHDDGDDVDGIRLLDLD